LEPSAAGTTATFGCDVTALVREANPAVQEFAAGCDDYLEGWRDAKAAIGTRALGDRDPPIGNPGR
jgi:hypothetical protein